MKLFELRKKIKSEKFVNSFIGVIDEKSYKLT